MSRSDVLVDADWAEAHLDDGDLWPVSYALRQWSPVVEKKVVELVRAATS